MNFLRFVSPLLVMLKKMIPIGIVALKLWFVICFHFNFVLRSICRFLYVKVLQM